VATFLSGLVLHGLDVLHFSNGRLALEAAIAAGLSFLGWEGLTLTRHAGADASSPPPE